MTVIAVNTEKEYQDQIFNSQTVIFKFGAKWCKPCMKISPDYHDLAKKHDAVTFCEVDVDDATGIKDAAEINSMPTFLIYKDREPVAKITGTNLKLLLAEI